MKSERVLFKGERVLIISKEPKLEAIVDLKMSWSWSMIGFRNYSRLYLLMSL